MSTTPTGSRLERAARAVVDDFPFLTTRDAMKRARASGSERVPCFLNREHLEALEALRDALAEAEAGRAGQGAATRCTRCGNPVTLMQSQLPDEVGLPCHKNCPAPAADPAQAAALHLERRADEIQAGKEPVSAVNELRDAARLIQTWSKNFDEIVSSGKMLGPIAAPEPAQAGEAVAWAVLCHGEMVVAHPKREWAEAQARGGPGVPQSAYSIQPLYAHPAPPAPDAALLERVASLALQYQEEVPWLTEKEVVARAIAAAKGGAA